MPTDTILIQGRKLEVSVWPGQGSPLLLINGMRWEQGTFSRLRKELSRPTITFNFPREWNLFDWLPSMDKLATLTAELISRLNYQKVDVMGTSWSGVLALELARRYPALLGKLILAATTADPRVHFMKPQITWAFLCKQYGGKVAREPALLRELQEEACRSPLATDWYRGCSLPPVGGVLGWEKIKHPTLVLAGTEDPIVPPAEAKKLTRITGSRYQEIRDGHLFVWSSAQETAAHIEAFLTDQPVLLVA